MIQQKFYNIYDEWMAEGAILNEEFTGFSNDYLLLHCLILKYQPKTLFEIGTNCGTGTNIICNAMKSYCPDYRVFSLDLPTEIIHGSLRQDDVDRVGVNCKFPYIQLCGNSMTYDYLKHYPIDGWFIDGEHIYENVRYESIQAFLSKPKLIVWHDTDIPEVLKAIQEVTPKNYQLYRIIGTRISYSIPKINL